MKVFLNNHDFSKLNIDYDSSYNQNFIYSNEGIFVFKQNKLYTFDITNEENETVLFKGHEFLIDKSKQLTNEIIYHIPYEHISCNETFYKKNIGNGITFVKREFFDQISYYFEIEGKLESFMFAKMFTFVI
jgi:hypothetical protein